MIRIKTFSSIKATLLMGSAVLAGLSAITAPVLAQSSAPTVEKVTVTGTRIKKPNNTSATATTTVNSETIEISGEGNVVDVLRDLPQAGVSGISSVNSNFQTTLNGVNTLNLRNLGEDRTLVLVNGRRFVAGVPLSEQVDFNSIPTELIDRIDVVSGGSSAVYGSDAVAGVVNVILKKNFEGISANVQWGRPDEYNDADTFRASAIAGANFDGGKGNATFFINWGSNGAALARSRPGQQIDCLSDIFFGGSAFTQSCPFKSSFAEGGNYLFSTSAGGAQTRQSLAANGTLSPFVSATQGFNRQSQRLNYVPFDKRGVASTINYDFVPGHSFFGEFTWSDTTSTSQIEPFPLDSANIYGESAQVGSLNINNRRSGVAPDNPYMPKAMLDLLCNRYLGLSLLTCQATARATLVTNLMATPDAAVGFNRRMTELGNRGQEFNSSTARAVVGLEGQLGTWDYEFSYNYGITKANQIGNGQLNVSNFRQALDAIDLNTDADNNPLTNPQDVVCRDNTARLQGCVPVNIFTVTTVPGLWTDKQKQWLKADVFRQQEQKQEILSFNTTGDLFENWAGMIEGSVGGEYRRESGADVPDALSQSGQNASNVAPRTSGAFDVWEAFAEVQVPLLKDLPGIKSFDVHGGARVSEYSTLGQTFAWSGDASWVVTDGIRLRGQLSRSVRAPNIGDLFTGASENFATVTDPCNNIEVTALDFGNGAPYTNLNGAGTTDQTVLANCLLNPAIAARATAPGGFVLTQPELQGTGGFGRGNPNLFEETSDSTQLGVVVSPAFWGDWVGNLTVSFDYYKFEIEDAIGSVSRNNTLKLCYNSTALSSPFCDNTPGGPIGFVRDVNGALKEVNTASANVNAIETSGFDLQADYAFEVGQLLISDADLGMLNLNAQWTHLNTYSFTALANTPFASESTGKGAIGFAEDEVIASAVYKVGAIRLSWSGQYMSSANDYDPYIIKGQWFHDFAGRYQVMDNLAIYGGVRNAFNNYVFIGQGLNQPTGWTTEPDVYDGLGRRFYVGARIDF